MTRTLLSLVQDVAVALDSDEINSIGDSVEAQSIATIIRNCYETLVAQLDLPSTQSFFELDASQDLALPVVMYVPTNVANLLWVKYDNQDPSTDVTAKYRLVTFVPFQEYLDYMHNLDGSDTAVQSYTYTKSDGESLTILAYNDRFPKYYTTFDDHTLVFDAFNAAVDGTLQASKTLCWGELDGTFLMTDTYTIALNPRQTNLLLNEAKAQAFLDLKQTSNPRYERNARRGAIHAQSDKFRVDHHNPLDDTPDYSR